MTAPLLEVDDLHLRFPTPAGEVQALRGLHLRVERGETLGLVGESGCGKSQAALALLRLTPPGGRIVKGSVRYHARGRPAPLELLATPERDMRALRGRDLSIIFQEPMTSLNPVMSVGEQIVEAILEHQDVGVRLRWLDRWMLRRGLATRRYREARRAARPRARDMLQAIGIADAQSVLDRYPHELSGGMRQRVMIAMALACEPELLIADEPTTSLDVTVQAQILQLLRDLKRRTKASILLITHHLGVVAQTADRVAVMYAGRVVEVGPTESVLRAPLHPYTIGLVRSVPGESAPDAPGELPVIEGQVPDLVDPPGGCAFHPRCPLAIARCREDEPELRQLGAQQVACHVADEEARA